MTERLHFHFSLSCIGEGNGNLLQCSCLENPRDGGAWWAAIYGVAQSQTQLKRLSSSSKLTFMEMSVFQGDCVIKQFNKSRWLRIEQFSVHNKTQPIHGNSYKNVICLPLKGGLIIIIVTMIIIILTSSALTKNVPALNSSVSMTRVLPL